MGERGSGVGGMEVGETVVKKLSNIKNVLIKKKQSKKC